mgnify:CR=1 FL=1
MSTTPQQTHTPAPWTMKGPSAPGPRHDDGGDYAIKANGEIIAEVFRRVSVTRIEPVEANARLIAAAPELLAVLKGLQPVFTRLIEQYEPDNLTDAEWTIHALEAIRKADGG